MKQVILSISFLFLVAGCVGSGTDDAKMVLNIDAVNFCSRAVGETVVWNDVQITNTSRGELTLSNIRIRGNATCAFEVSYPRESNAGKLKTSTVKPEGKGSFTPLTIPPFQGIVLKVAYTPSGEGVTDQAALVIASNAANLNSGSDETVTTVIPMCGEGVNADALSIDVQDAGIDMDAGLDMDAGIPDAGAAECKSCGKALKKGAPGCDAE